VAVPHMRNPAKPSLNANNDGADTSTSTSRSVLLGSVWLMTGQVVVVVVQLVYAGSASRLVEPEAFGSYAIALALMPLISLATSAGLGNAAARMPTADEQSLRGLVSIALLLGAVGTAATLLLAAPWARLWGSPPAAEAIRWSALVAFLTPLALLLNGIMQREGRFRSGAIARTLAAIGAMPIGYFVVRHFKSAPSLLATNLAIVVFQVTLLTLSRRSVLWPGRLSKAALGHLKFGSKVTVSSLFGYASFNVPLLALGRSLGADALGNWNRAVTVSQVPVEMVQQAMAQALYPEFRHDITDSARAKRVWPDLLAITAWIAFPLAAILAAALPWLMPFLLGDGWESATRIAPWLAVIAGAGVPIHVLGIALEATSRFKSLWPSQIFGLVVATIVGGLTFALNSPAPILVGAFLSKCLLHGMQLRSAHRARLLNGRDVIARYGTAAGAAAFLGATTHVILRVLLDSHSIDPALRVLSAALASGTIIVGVWLLRARIPLWQLAIRHRLVKGDFVP
jgi:O-antigen/teichoic acid export membrane protein